MEFRNCTRFPALAYEAVDQLDQEFHVVAMRVTLDMRAGDPPAFAARQGSLVLNDQHFSWTGWGSVRQEGDLAPFKPRCDVIVNGTAHAPGGRPVPSFNAGIRITSAAGPVILEKTLTVTGSRFWKENQSGWELTAPEPIAILPLRYEYAYGGENRIGPDNMDDPAAKRLGKEDLLTPEERAQHPDGPERAPAAHSAYEANPLGLGYYEQWYLNATRGERPLPAPQIESPADPVKEIGRRYAPQGFGIIGKAWVPRRQLFGAVDQAFMDSGKRLPADFDFAYWNGAPPDMQVPYLQGDETIELINLLPDEACAKITLPGYRAYLLAQVEGGLLMSRFLKTDTLIIDTDNGTITLGHRAVLAQEGGMRAIETRVMNREEAKFHDTMMKEIKEKLKMERERTKGGADE